MDAQQRPQNDFKIVRYMNLAKFLSLITTSSLHFCNFYSLKESDPFEGEINQKDIDFIIGDFLQKHYIEPNNFLHRSEIINAEKKIRNIVINSILINCWRILESDSYAMWKLYSDLEYGIAITTTTSKLYEATNPLIINRFSQIQEVSYKNYQQENIIADHHLFDALLLDYNQILNYDDYINNPQKYANDPNKEAVDNFILNFWQRALAFYTPLIFSKRKEFEYERELRVATIITLNDRGSNNNQSLESLKIPINLNTLIDEIFIPTNAPTWFRETIDDIVKKYGINKTIYQSNLLINPIHI